MLLIGGCVDGWVEGSLSNQGVDRGSRWGACVI